MTKIFIIHGIRGNPTLHWFPWLKEELEKLDHEVIIPHFPAPPEHNLDSWMRIFEPYMKDMQPDTIFVGHSIGCSFILSILEKLETQIKASFFVAGFLKELTKQEHIESNRTFLEKEYNWEKIRQNCPTFHLLQFRQ